MSDQPEHQHEHGPNCGCGHDHGPAQGTSPQPTSPAPTPELPSGEEASTQALSDALQSSFVLVKIAMAGLLIAFLCSGIFTVGSQERAMILRFGKPVGEGDAVVLGPGLHWAYPYPIDEVIKIPAAQIQSVVSSIGWYAMDPKLTAANAETPPNPSLNPVIDGYTLTGDGNIIHVKATLRYRVTDPVRYYFSFTNAAEMVTNALNNSLLYASAQFTVDNATRRNRAAFKEKILNRVNQLIAEQQLGISLEPSEIDCIPPRQVKEAFDEVLAAENERSKTINDAQGYANEVLSKAKGEGQALINTGETDKARLVASVQAEALYFQELLPEYRKNPQLFTARLQAETLTRVMTNAQDKFFLSERADGKPRELRLQLSREPMKPKTPEPPKADTH